MSTRRNKKRKRSKHGTSGCKNKRKRQKMNLCFCGKQTIIGAMWYCNNCDRSFHEKCIEFHANGNELKCLFCDISNDDNVVFDAGDNTMENKLMDLRNLLLSISDPPHNNNSCVIPKNTLDQLQHNIKHDVINVETTQKELIDDLSLLKDKKRAIADKIKKLKTKQ